MTRGIHWFRNDLRLQDNSALTELTSRVDAWLPVFIIDRRLTTAAGESRRHFLADTLVRLDQELKRRGARLVVMEGAPEKVLPKLLDETGSQFLSFNEDSTPFARRRDVAVRRVVERSHCEVLERLDRVVFRASEIRTAADKPYAVYTPYKKSWWKRWELEPRLPAGPTRLPPLIPGWKKRGPIDGERLGLRSDRTQIPTGGSAAARRRLERFLESSAGRYHIDRDRPDIDGTSRLSPYLRFGAISARQCFARAQEAIRDRPQRRQGVEKWLDELVWRDFYAAILEENPRVLRENHRREFDSLAWNDDPDGFDAWCSGRTGYPIVDAGMRQLRETGWMHNRVRMIVSSFLTKDLLIDWREGERFFFRNLLDAEPASNSGGWQWAASTGTDAQPYFRVFNPTLQGKKWDPKGRYVRRWIPELRGVPDVEIHSPPRSASVAGYPAPIVDHGAQRKLAIERFRAARPRGR